MEVRTERYREDPTKGYHIAVVPDNVVEKN